MTCLGLRFHISFVLLSFLLLGCASPPTKQGSGGEPLPEEVSLREDRAQLDELRKEVPDEVKKDNDEIAFVLGMFREFKQEPYEVRSRFDTAVRKRRDFFDKNMRRDRDDFSKGERDHRERFLRDQKDARDTFLGSKRKADERQRFFDEQDQKRKRFFDEGRDKRQEFEAKMKERRDEFNAYVREKQNFFEQEYRRYGQEYRERKNLERKKEEMEKKKKAIVPPAENQDLEQIPKANKTRLGVDDE